MKVTTKEQVILVDIFGEMVSNVADLLHMNINYVYGRQSQIIGKLHDMEGSKTYKDAKYPLFAVYQDFPEKRGLGYYANIVLPKIIIATLTVSTDYSDTRYDVTFKPVLYPIYYEFLHQIALHRNIAEADEDFIQHTKWDRVGTLPIGSDVQDYVDAIEINNLTLTVSQSKFCSNGTH